MRHVENIRAVAEAIRQATVPGLGFHMNMIHGARDHVNFPDKTGRDCETVACIAGWTVAVLDGPGEIPDDPIAVKARARALLRLEVGEVQGLFYPYDHLESATPAQAAEVLHQFANRGVVDWGAVDENGKRRAP